VIPTPVKFVGDSSGILWIRSHVSIDGIPRAWYTIFSSAGESVTDVHVASFDSGAVSEPLQPRDGLLAVVDARVVAFGRRSRDGRGDELLLRDFEL
jgi:hypothetical protein